MSMYGGGHRGMGAVPPGNSVGRLTELLDQIRSEFETQMRASESYEHQSKHCRPFRDEVAALAPGLSFGAEQADQDTSKAS